MRVSRAGDLAVRPRADDLVDLARLAADARELLTLVVLIAHLGRGRGRGRRRRRGKDSVGVALGTGLGLALRVRAGVKVRGGPSPRTW